MERLRYGTLRQRRKFLRSARFLLAVSSLTIAIGSVVWPGCLSVPIPAKREIVLSRSQQHFIARTNLTRIEIFKKVGEPDVYLPENKMAAYRLKTITKRRLQLLCIFPVDVESTDRSSEVAFLQFNEEDRLIRSIRRKLTDISDLKVVTRQIASTNGIPQKP